MTQFDLPDLSMAVRRVFISGDPYRPRFAYATLAHTILAPTNGSMLDRTQFDAVGRAHGAEGGPVYVLPVPDYELDFPSSALGEDSGCYAIDFGKPQTYFSAEYRAYMSVENLIVPINGEWGILVAEDVHAIVAGTGRFVEAVLRHTTLSPEEMGLILVRRWKELAEIGLSIPWLPDLLDTMYGSAEAARLAALDCG